MIRKMNLRSSSGIRIIDFHNIAQETILASLIWREFLLKSSFNCMHAILFA